MNFYLFLVGVKPFWLKIHLYLGLLALPYLLVFGLSALHINHDLPLFRENQSWEPERSLTIQLPDSCSNQLFAEAIRDSLDIMGWCPFWQQAWNGKVFSFTITNPGGDYQMRADRQSGTVTVLRRPKGFWSVVNSLHFFGGIIPNGELVLRPWGLYQSFTVIYLLTAVCTGIYLFIRNTRERLAGWLIVCTSTAISLILMLYVWLVG